MSAKTGTSSRSKRREGQLPSRQRFLLGAAHPTRRSGDGFDGLPSWSGCPRHSGLASWPIPSCGSFMQRRACCLPEVPAQVAGQANSAAVLRLKAGFMEHEEALAKRGPTLYDLSNAKNDFPWSRYFGDARSRASHRKNDRRDRKGLRLLRHSRRRAPTSGLGALLVQRMRGPKIAGEVKSLQ